VGDPRMGQQEEGVDQSEPDGAREGLLPVLSP
jgi:hypothetical protein